jgi:tetratricopeptide (TPR) repeat protein/transcriptional regulator with XRE-family HTH domain
MFGAQVRVHRQRLGMTQEELAARTGVSVRSIHRLETGYTERPRAGTVGLLADAFGLAGADRDQFCQSAIEPADEADDAAAHSRPVPAQLPADVAGFAGRTDQLNRLTRLLDDGDMPTTVVISAIAGTAGVGKTALAVHWAHQILDRFPDGQLYVNLRGFGPDGAVAPQGEVVRSFLDALDVPPQRVPAGLDAQAALYRSLLAERRMLVLLDNARDVEQVRPLLPGAPGCLVVVTSRNQLTGLVAGAGAIPLPLDLLSPEEGRDLLAQRLGVNRIAIEPDAVDEIIERCARLPLALAVVAARAATQPGLPLAALAAELRHPHDRLDTLATGDAGTDVRSVFSWSYQQLSPLAARLFRLLSMHPGPDLSMSAAAGLAGLPPARVRPLLAELLRAHLVAERVLGRYALHDLLRAYAGELAATGEPEADRQAAVRRLLDHYLRCAHQAATVLHPARDMIELIEPLAGVTVDNVDSAAAATAWFTTEYPVLRVAVRLAVDAGLDRHAWQLVWSMATFINHRDLRDAVALHRVALQAARRLGDPVAQGYSHRLIGRVCALLAEHHEAQAHLEHALELYRQLGDDTNQAHLHLALAEMMDRQGRYRDALHQAEQALARYQTSGHRVGQATALNNVGWHHAQLGDYETALQYCEQARGRQQELGDRRNEAITWHCLGVAYHHLGRHADAVAAYQHALARFRDTGNRYNEADTLVNLGETYRVTGETGAARDCWRAALAIFTDFEYPDAEQVRARLRNAP